MQFETSPTFRIHGVTGTGLNSDSMNLRAMALKQTWLTWLSKPEILI